MLKRVRSACERHHGVALTPYVEFLMQDLQRAERRAKAYMAEFMDGLDTTRMSGAMEHAAENLSLIYAGGCLAIDAGILPYRKSDVLRAVERCFRHALQTAAEESDPMLRAKRLLRRYLESNHIVEMKSPNDSFDARRFDGYVADDGGRSRYVVPRHRCAIGSGPTGSCKRTCRMASGKRLSIGAPTPLRKRS